jgi:hypothetical protein
MFKMVGKPEGKRRWTLWLLDANPSHMQKQRLIVQF